MTFQKGDKVTVRAEYCEKHGLSRDKLPIRGTIKQINQKSKPVRVGVYLQNAMYGNGNLLWLPVDELKTGWQTSIFEMTLLDQIHFWWSRGAKQVIIHPDDCNEVMNTTIIDKQHSDAMMGHASMAGVQLVSSAGCIKGRVYPVPEDKPKVRHDWNGWR